MADHPLDLFRRYSRNPILTADDWPYPVNSAFNPGATTLADGTTLLMVRVEDRRGQSHLTAARSRDGFAEWKVEPSPTFAPAPETHPEEIWGVEDPRVTRLDELGTWAMTYTAYSPRGPLVSLALTKDFVTFERLGPVLPPENKDAAIFPRKIGGRFAMLHRPVSGWGANVWVAYSPDLRHWGDHAQVLPARSGAWWDAGKVGINAPPLETPEGWLVVYHGVRTHCSGALYRLGMVLLDLEDPTRVLHRTEGWVMGPVAEYELYGDVGGVVFPCGLVHHAPSDQVRLYYGGADTVVAVATARLADLLEHLRTQPGA